MRVFYAKLWLKQFIKYRSNDKYFIEKLNDNIINLSHRVYKKRGMRGHDTRQDIRRILVLYAFNEVKLRCGYTLDIKNFGTENMLFETNNRIPYHHKLGVYNRMKNFIYKIMGLIR
jgi:hypothetical protein